MKFNFKRKLSFLSVLSLSTMTSSFVTSCGMTVKDIDDRIINDSDTYTYFLKKNMQFPTTFLSQSANDFYVYADSFATIITYDQYGRSQGDIAMRQQTKGDVDSALDVEADTDNNASSDYVGLHNKDFSFWQYKFRKNATWVDSSGQVQAQLTGQDFINTCKSVLYAPLGSSVSSLVSQFITNSSEINQYFTKDSNSEFSHTVDVYKYKQTPNNGCPYELVVDGGATPDKNSSDDTKDYVKTIDKYSGSGDDWINSEIWDYLGVWLGDADQSKNNDSSNVDKYNLNIALTGSFDYFESILSYAAFAPISDHFMTIDSTVTVSNDLFKNKLWYSGAYYIDSYKTSDYVKLIKNDNYFWANKTKIKKINWMITPTMTSTSDQEYFESGITSQFGIYSSNLNAWKKYIGDDYNQPNSTALTEMYDTNYPYSWGIYYDYAFSSDKCISKEAQNVDSQTANMLIISDIVRSYVATNLNRSTFAEGYCSLYDESQNNGKSLDTASWVTNTLTADDLSKDTSSNKTDYTQYVQKEYENIASGGGYRSSNSSKKASDSDTLEGNSKAAKGSDAYYQNSTLLDNLFDINGNKISTNEELKNAVIAYINDGVKSGTMKLGSDGKAQLVWLAQTNLRTYRYLKAMIEDFNNIEGNPLEIIVDGTADADQYNDVIENFGTSFEMWGWGPDYADPSTYLNTFSLGGDMASYIGLPDIFQNTTSTSTVSSILSNVEIGDTTADTITYQNTDSLSDTYYNSENVNKITKALGLSDSYSYLQKSKYWNKFITQNVEYSNSVRIANKGGSNQENYIKNYTVSDGNDDTASSFANEKYNAYAVTETNAIMQDFLWTPMYRYAKYTPSLSYLEPFQTPEALFGTSFDKHWNASLSTNLIKKNEFDVIKKDYENKLIISKDPSKVRDVIDWYQESGE